MEPKLEPLTRGISELEALDGPSGKVQELTKKFVPQDSDLKDFLSGTWLGHPLHPPLTDVVVGTWAAASILDLLAPISGRKAADRLIFVGILTAVPTAASGLSDWAELYGPQQRIGLVHASGNVAATYLQMKSWWARKRGKRFKGVVLSLSAMGIATVTAYLGGHLSFRKGVGVDNTAFEPWPEDFKAVKGVKDLPEGQMTRGQVDGVAVLLYRKGATIHALSDRCTHRGCSLSDGETDGSAVTCPCHGSRFRLEDGHVIQGPAIAPAKSFQVRERNGKVEVRLPAS
jgi:nitrite reductase/ring-hydroxylating ferredoxin subunit/uncharacterized membrane protein